MQNQISTSSALVGSIVAALNSGFFGLVLTIMPYALGIFIFLVGLQWAYRSLSGNFGLWIYNGGLGTSNQFLRNLGKPPYKGYNRWRSPEWNSEHTA